MSLAKSTDLISFTFLFQVLFVLVLLLLGTYMVLYFVSRFLKLKVQGAKKDRINILESKVIPRVGNICMVSVDAARYLVVSSAAGIVVTPLSDLNGELEESSEITKNVDVAALN